MANSEIYITVTSGAVAYSRCKYKGLFSTVTTNVVYVRTRLCVATGFDLVMCKSPISKHSVYHHYFDELLVLMLILGRQNHRLSVISVFKDCVEQALV